MNCSTIISMIVNGLICIAIVNLPTSPILLLCCGIILPNISYALGMWTVIEKENL